MSCTDSPGNVEKPRPEQTSASELDSLAKTPSADAGSRIEVDFSQNKDLLDAILLLPDSAFASWEWKLKDRKSWYNEIESNNFYIDNDPQYFTQTNFGPNFAKFTIVDGTWSISLYKATDNSFIVISNDVAGDGKDINIYEIKANEIVRTSTVEKMFGDYYELLKQQGGNQECQQKYNEIEHPLFDFNFSDPVMAEIESSWYLLKDEYSDCLQGNALLYKFNTYKKTFDLEKIYWKAKTDD